MLGLFPPITMQIPDHLFNSSEVVHPFVRQEVVPLGAKDSSGPAADSAIQDAKSPKRDASLARSPSADAERDPPVWPTYPLQLRSNNNRKAAGD